MAGIKEIRTRIDSVQQTLKITNAMYLISSVNHYEGEIRKRGRRFQSSKHTGNGVGIWSVEKVVEKYNGMMTIDVGEEKFEVKIAIPIE